MPQIDHSTAHLSDEASLAVEKAQALQRAVNVHQQARQRLITAAQPGAVLLAAKAEADAAVDVAIARDLFTRHLGEASS